MHVFDSILIFWTEIFSGLENSPWRRRCYHTIDTARCNPCICFRRCLRREGDRAIRWRGRWGGNPVRWRRIIWEYPAVTIAVMWCVGCWWEVQRIKIWLKCWYVPKMSTEPAQTRPVNMTPAVRCRWEHRGRRFVQRRCAGRWLVFQHTGTFVPCC